MEIREVSASAAPIPGGMLIGQNRWLAPPANIFRPSGPQTTSVGYIIFENALPAASTLLRARLRINEDPESDQQHAEAGKPMARRGSLSLGGVILRIIVVCAPSGSCTGK